MKILNCYGVYNNALEYLSSLVSTVKPFLTCTVHTCETMVSYYVYSVFTLKQIFEYLNLHSNIPEYKYLPNTLSHILYRIYEVRSIIW